MILIICRYLFFLIFYMLGVLNYYLGDIMNLRVVLVIMFVILCTLSIVVASDVYHETPSADQDGGHESHIHHRTEYMQEFSQSHPDFNVWNALGSELGDFI